MPPARNTDNPRVTIVIPVLNEARNLEIVIPQLPPVHEIVIVDGRSSDDTIATARRVAPEATILTQTRHGKGNALCCGFEAATGDMIVMFDADGSADPAEIAAFVETLRRGADFAKGSRNRPGGGSHDITLLRDLGNGALNALSNLLIGSNYTDLCYGYNAFWTDILPTLRLPHTDPASGERLWGDGFEIETMLTCRVAQAQLTVTEVASVERARIHGTSNLNAVTDGIRVLRTILVEQLGNKGRNIGDALSVRSKRPVTERAIAAEQGPSITWRSMDSESVGAPLKEQPIDAGNLPRPSADGHVGPRVVGRRAHRSTYAAAPRH